MKLCDIWRVLRPETYYMVEWSDCKDEKGDLAKYRYGVITTTHLSEEDGARNLKLGDNIHAFWPEESGTGRRRHYEASILGIEDEYQRALTLKKKYENDSRRLEADNAEGDSDGFIPILTGDEDSDSNECNTPTKKKKLVYKKVIKKRTELPPKTTQRKKNHSPKTKKPPAAKTLGRDISQKKLLYNSNLRETVQSLGFRNLSDGEDDDIELSPDQVQMQAKDLLRKLGSKEDESERDPPAVPNTEVSTKDNQLGKNTTVLHRDPPAVPNAEVSTKDNQLGKDTTLLHRDPPAVPNAEVSAKDNQLRKNTTVLRRVPQKAGSSYSNDDSSCTLAGPVMSNCHCKEELQMMSTKVDKLTSVIANLISMLGNNQVVKKLYKENKGNSFTMRGFERSLLCEGDAAADLSSAIVPAGSGLVPVPSGFVAGVSAASTPAKTDSPVTVGSTVSPKENLLKDVSNQSNLFVGDPIYGVTINAQTLEGLKGGTSSRSKMTLTLLEKLFSGDVLATSTVAGSKQSKMVNALDNSKLMAIKSFVFAQFPLQKEETLETEWGKLIKSMNAKCRGFRHGRYNKKKEDIKENELV